MSCVDGSRVARVLFIDDAVVGCSLVSGLLMRCFKTAGLDGFRGCLGTEITSALTEAGLAGAPTVSLTVRRDNTPAVRVYEKLGYSKREDRIWVDHEANSAP